MNVKTTTFRLLWTRHGLWSSRTKTTDRPTESTMAELVAVGEGDFPAIGFTGLQFEGQKLG